MKLKKIKAGEYACKVLLNHKITELFIFQDEYGWQIFNNVDGDYLNGIAFDFKNLYQAKNYIRHNYTCL